MPHYHLTKKFSAKITSPTGTVVCVQRDLFMFQFSFKDFLRNEMHKICRMLELNTLLSGSGKNRMHARLPIPPVKYC